MNVAKSAQIGEAAQPTPPALPQPRRTTRLIKGGLIGLLAAAAIALVLPSLISGQWPWSQPPEVANIQPVQALRSSGIPLEGWQLTDQEEVRISGKNWSAQQFNQGADSDRALVLLLLPQPWHTNLPQVEWVDLSGSQNWDIRYRQTLTIPAAEPQGTDGTGHFRASFFRGANDQRTYAVLQWYAWPGGGSPSPGRWFFADQWHQLRYGHRLPWIAVSLWQPMVGRGDIQPLRDDMVAIAQEIQATLNTTALLPAIQPQRN